VQTAWSEAWVRGGMHTRCCTHDSMLGAGAPRSHPLYCSCTPAVLEPRPQDHLASAHCPECQYLHLRLCSAQACSPPSPLGLCLPNARRIGTLMVRCWSQPVSPCCCSGNKLPLCAAAPPLANSPSIHTYIHSCFCPDSRQGLIRCLLCHLALLIQAPEALLDACQTTLQEFMGPIHEQHI